MASYKVGAGIKGILTGNQISFRRENELLGKERRGGEDRRREGWSSEHLCI